MGRRLSFREISLAYGVGTVATLSAGTVGGTLMSHWGMQVDLPSIVGGTWLLFVGGPSVLVTADTLRRVLGEKRPVQVQANALTQGRAVPVNYGNGKQTHVFLSSIPWRKQSAAPAHLTPPDSLSFASPSAINLPQSFQVLIDGNSYTITVPEMADFLYGVWRRQRSGLAGLSRKYWTQDRRPHRLKTNDYNARLHILLSVEGLVVDRQERRSGRLIVPPQQGLKLLQSHFV